VTVLNEEKEPLLQGKWLYEPDGCFEISLEDGALTFNEFVASGERYHGTLAAQEGWYVTELLCDGVVQGNMRLRLSGDGLKAHFRESAEEPWGLVLDARREQPPGGPPVSRSKSRGPLGSNPSQGRPAKTAASPQVDEDAIRQAFERFDKDGSGQIDLAELRSLCAELGRPLGDVEAEEAMNALDANSSGTVTLDEFRTWWLAKPGEGAFNFAVPALDFLKFRPWQASSVTDEAEIRRAFDRFDKDGSGQIDLEELQNLCAELGRPLSDGEVEEAMIALDANSSGTVTLDEFRTWWRANPGERAVNFALPALDFLKLGWSGFGRGAAA